MTMLKKSGTYDGNDIMPNEGSPFTYYFSRTYLTGLSGPLDFDPPSLWPDPSLYITTHYSLISAELNVRQC